jgi:YHS domain-containing protein
MPGSAYYTFGLESQGDVPAIERSRNMEKEYRDPVCNMRCDEKTGQKVERDGKTYYFCSDSCKKAFEKNPEMYVKEGPTTHTGGESYPA